MSQYSIKNKLYWCHFDRLFLNQKSLPVTVKTFQTANLVTIPPPENVMKSERSQTCCYTEMCTKDIRPSVRCTPRPRLKLHEPTHCIHRGRKNSATAV